ncbi:hypothetical protein ES319_A02G150800v1 [Gossypium barbadense]|uniref:Uncharacterized protein n=2 Tax=Gossypium TaxID=3633 RepID=A0A5J5WNE3_GOSBA|nr:hypothetical protein ES319_A02G150800v1 [Gossypium barbadense]
MWCRGYVGIHSSGFRDFLLKPELFRSIVDSGNLMHWLSQMFSPAKGNYKGTSSSRSGGNGEKKRRT